MTWPPPELGAGAWLGLRPDELEEGVLELEEEGVLELEEGGLESGLDGRDDELAGAGVRGAEVPGAAGCAAALTVPGSATATAPAVTTLARATVVVIEPTRPCPASRAATRWRISCSCELRFFCDTQGEARTAT